MKKKADKILKNDSMVQNNIFFISGKQGHGKTMFLETLIKKFIENNFIPAGFSAPGFWYDNVRSRFDLKNISTGEKMLLCSIDKSKGFVKYGRFYFNPYTIMLGEELINAGVRDNADILVIDEIGKFELNGKVWDSIFKKMILSGIPMLAVVRDVFIEKVKEKYGINNVEIFYSYYNPDLVFSDIVKKINLNEERFIREKSVKK